MKRLQAIENALSAINETIFQELCDSYLSIRNPNYAAFSRIGSKSGKQKTSVGTPDSFLLLPNGKYIFVEHSTNISEGVSKLKEDIEKCLNTSKTGIPINEIVEIIICINFNLKTNEVQELKTLLKKTRIALTINTLDSLALELHIHHRDLVHSYLGLPLDTGQIVSIKKFIEEYNNAATGIATPLDNIFFHREKELSELKASIQNSNFIILTGAPGIGKTKLAIEAINEFLSENIQYNAYCISYKSHSLLEDLYQNIDFDKDYILFVDDANRIDAFNQITGYCRASRRGNLKVIITVRDYAYQEIGILCQEFHPKRIDIEKLSDEQIIDIIKSDSYKILNSDYQKEIVRIADGNPRLAIMTALLAKAKQDIKVLSDVSDLFEKYFSTFIKDKGEFSEDFNIKCLGLISFFYTLPYKDRNLLTPILQNFSIDYSDFIDAIDRLDKLELVELQFEYVKIPEQNLATYFFYRAFIKDTLLSFDLLLIHYFESNPNRFTDSVIPANNTFGPQNVMNKLRPYLQKYWDTIQFDKDKSYNFLEVFWFYLQNEALEFLYNEIQKLPQVDNSTYETHYEQNTFAYDKNRTIELLGEFLHFPLDPTDALELSFEFVRKQPQHLPELIHKIREQLVFDWVDHEYGFQRQFALFDLLIKGLNNGDKLYISAFYELAKTFLSFTFRHTKGGRNHSITFYEYPIPTDQYIYNFRSKIWSTLNSNFTTYPDQSFKLLKIYNRVHPDVTKEIMEFDIPFVIDIINKYLTQNSFEHCLYVQDQIRWCKRNSVNNLDFPKLINQFTNPKYEMFLKIDWDRFRDKEMYEFDNYKEYEKLKEDEIRSSFIFKTESEVSVFFDTFVYLKALSKNDWNYNTTIDFIIDENLNNNFDIGCKIYEAIVKTNNEINFVPRISFKNHLRTNDEIEKIWYLIQNNSFKGKTYWELSFYDFIDDALINKSHPNAIINTINQVQESITIHFDRLERYLLFDSQLFHKILKIITEKNDAGSIQIRTWLDFFNQQFDKLGDDIELIKKAYLQQEKIQSHFDFESKGFLNILIKDPSFIIDFINALYSDKQLGISNDHKDLGFIWKVDNIESQLIKVFDLIIEKEPYFGISTHFCNAFFRNLEDEYKTKADKFLIDYVIANNQDPKKMNVIVDIVRHTRKDLFEKILLTHISLNQDRDIFSKIYWRGNGGTFSGNVIIGDIEAADWRNILSIVEKSNLGIKLIPIKKYINDEVESSLRSGDWERKRRFLERY